MFGLEVLRLGRMGTRLAKLSETVESGRKRTELAKKPLQAIFITLIFILASFQSAYAIGESFTYDANGNMVEGADRFYYEYNDANQLERVRDGGPDGEVIAEYWYDHTSRRIKKNESGVVTYYWSESFEQTVHPNGTVVNTTYYFANGERLAKNVSTDSGSKMYYFHPDHLGSTSVVSDENGSLVEETEYYPYGEVREGGSEQYLFTGKELDKSTGLYYYGARYYNPELTRFVEADPILQEPYDPQSLNRYAYVRNNPLKYTDPTGNYVQTLDTVLASSLLFTLGALYILNEPIYVPGATEGTGEQTTPGATEGTGIQSTPGTSSGNGPLLEAPGEGGQGEINDLLYTPADGPLQTGNGPKPIKYRDGDAYKTPYWSDLTTENIIIDPNAEETIKIYTDIHPDNNKIIVRHQPFYSDHRDAQSIEIGEAYEKED